MVDVLLRMLQKKRHMFDASEIWREPAKVGSVPTILAMIFIYTSFE